MSYLTIFTILTVLQRQGVHGAGVEEAALLLPCLVEAGFCSFPTLLMAAENGLGDLFYSLLALHFSGRSKYSRAHLFIQNVQLFANNLKSGN